MHKPGKTDKSALITGCIVPQVSQRGGPVSEARQKSAPRQALLWEIEEQC